MPLYLHECPACRKEYELPYGMHAPVPPCPKCHGPMKRLIAGRGVFHLKGVGWSDCGYDCTESTQYDPKDFQDD